MEVVKSWLQDYFEKELPSAQELVDLFNTYAFEVEGLREEDTDSVIDIDVLPNRSSDCLSHRGVAKEIGTLLGEKLKVDPYREPLPNWSKPKKLTVSVDDALLTPRYMAAVVHGVNVGPSPKWLVTALKKLGQRSVNNIVDATNYVMFNLGQPIHAFDLEKLATDTDGAYNIRVRLAKKGEKITTLTGEEYTLSDTHQLITDGADDTPLALAGIKGGKHAEVDEGTTDIVVEVANFNAVIVRKASNELKLQTDASVRFQNNIVPHLAAVAMRDILKLIEDVASGKEAGVFDAYAQGYKENEPIQVSMKEIQTFLGVPLKESDVENILLRLEWEFSKSNDSFTVTGPWERTDITIKEDVIEEIGRIYGYKNINAKMPEIPQKNDVRISTPLYYTQLLQEAATELGYSEVLTYTIVATGEVELENPFASDKSFMRMDLQGGIENALELNIQHAPLLGLETVKIFEVGTVFTHKGERLHMALGARSTSVKQSKVDAQLQEDVEKIVKILGSDATFSVKDGVCEIDLDAIIPLLPKPKRYGATSKWNTEARYSKWSPYPFVLRDIAVWVPTELKPENIEKIITEKAGDLLVRHDLFDTFHKDGKVSYAWHLVFQSSERTLTDDEINIIMDAITGQIHEHADYTVR